MYVCIYIYICTHPKGLERGRLLVRSHPRSDPQDKHPTTIQLMLQYHSSSSSSNSSSSSGSSSSSSSSSSH